MKIKLFSISLLALCFAENAFATDPRERVKNGKRQRAETNNYNDDESRNNDSNNNDSNDNDNDGRNNNDNVGFESGADFDSPEWKRRCQEANDAHAEEIKTKKACRDPEGLQSLIGRFIIKKKKDFASSDGTILSGQERIDFTERFKLIISKYNLAAGSKDRIIDAMSAIVKKEQNFTTPCYETICEELVVRESQKYFEALGSRAQLRLIEEDGLTEATKKIVTKINLTFVLRGLSTERIVKIFENLKKFSNLTHLDLSDNWLGGKVEAVKAFAQALENLTHLDLNGNNLGENVEVAKDFAQALEKLENLTHLYLDGNDLGENVEVAKAFAQALEKLENLTHLDLNGNDLGENVEVAKAFAQALEKLENLTRLGLGDNKLGRKVEATKAFAQALKPLLKITYLDLSCNNLGENVEATKAFAPALKLLVNLKDLDLSDNHFSNEPEAAKALAPALKLLINLQNLDLSDNDEFEDEVSANPEVVKEFDEVCLVLFANNPSITIYAPELDEDL
jgi:Leucine-rich repeat (LRR) protein